MAIFNVPQVNFSADVRRTLGPVDVPAKSRHVQITLVSDDWVPQAGMGYFEFGVEQSTDGVNWILLVGTISQIGSMGKGLYMPSIGFTTGGPDMSGQLRLFGTATAGIRIGCQIVVDPAA